MGRKNWKNRIAGYAIVGVVTAISSADAQETSEHQRQISLEAYLQRLLAAKNCYHLEIDGIWGAESREAAAAFLNGEAGSQTATFLNTDPTLELRDRLHNSAYDCENSDPPPEDTRPRSIFVIINPEQVDLMGCPGPGCPASE